MADMDYMDLTVRCPQKGSWLDLITHFNGLGKDICKMRQETLGFGVAYIRGLTVQC